MNEIITYSPELQRLMDLCRRANERNDDNAQFDLAKILIRISSKNSVSQKKAFSIFKKLATQSYTPVQTDARYMLGVCYENGYGIQKSYPRAIRWYKMVGGSIGNDLLPLYKPFEDKISRELDKMLEGFENRVVTPEMMDFLIQAAENEDVEAQKRLSELYTFGDRYRKPNDEEAAYWLARAAENGDVDAMDQLGRMYYYGQGGVERNFRKGLDLMELAAERGSASSAYHLGLHQEKMKAYRKAAAWFRKYAQSEIRQRNKRLGRQ